MKKIVVFSDSYLKTSETFIYSQLRGIESAFNVLFLTQNLMNADHFPFTKVIEVKPRILQKVVRVFDPFSLHSPYAKKIEKVLIQESPDVVHTHFGTNAMRIAPILNRLKIPMLITFHGSDASKRLKDRKYLALLNRWLKEFDFICVSGALANNLRKNNIEVRDEQIHYIGVDINKFSFKERETIHSKVSRNEDVNFIQVARFVEKKGHAFTIKAFKDLLSTVESPQLFNLQFIGEGPLLEQIKELVSEEGIDERVQFMGSMSHNEVITLLHRADALFQHSVTSKSGDTEGLPIGIMEAMSTGLPVISTYHSGIPELINDGINGFLVQEKDTADYLNKMQELVEQEDSRIGQLARKTIVDRFNIDLQNQKLIEILKKCAGEY